MELVSIIVPVYNVEKYLKRCLESLLSQTYSNIEIICINDASTDKSLMILNEYGSKYEQIKIFCNEVNSGLGATRDYGINQAQGQYLMFVDSDDYVDSHWVEEYVLQIEKDDVDIVIGGYTIAKVGSEKKISVIKNEYTLFLYPSVWNKIYRKDFIVKNGINFAGLRRSEDEFWKMQLIILKPKYSVFENEGYFYWQNQESITRSKSNNTDIEKKLSVLLHKIYDILDLDSMNDNDYGMIEYDFISKVIIWNYLYNRGLSRKELKKRLDFSFDELSGFFPNFKKNKFVRFGVVKGGNGLANLLVSVEMFFYKLGLRNLIFYVINRFGSLK